jgi:hypothetical protein
VLQDPRYRRAAGYFAACLLAGVVSGVTADLADVHHGSPVAVSLAVLVLEVVAYGVVWPIGTYALDRPKDWVSTAFGVVWGLCEAQLLLSGFVLVEQLGLGKPATVAVAFVLLSAFQGGWHALYWDVRVAPEHNDPAWNLRKVLLCHVPNLLVTLTHYAVYRSALWFVVFQTVSLALSARAMRFPRPARSSEAQPVGRRHDPAR